jgi:transcriptional regulator of acetoin/glycerol metabolism
MKRKPPIPSEGIVEPHHLAELLDFEPNQGIIRLHEQRVVLLSAAAMGLMRKELIDTFGLETARRLFLRFVRLGAFVITVPPLRDRREDIPPLVHDFVRRAATRVKKDVENVSADAMTALMNYGWPGNVRELEHAIERAVIVARGTSIRLRELPPEVSQKSSQPASGDSLDLPALERAAIERALERFRGNRREAAQALKISTVTLWRKMKQYGLVA